MAYWGARGERGIAFVPFFAIVGEGRKGGRRTGELEPVLAVARNHGATPAQVQLTWTLAQGSHVLAIPGASSLAHLNENVAAGTLRLTEEELARGLTRRSRRHGRRQFRRRLDRPRCSRRPGGRAGARSPSFFATA